MFMAELKNLELWATDIDNAYLEALTAENVYIIFVHNIENWKVMP
jgi:hypothetical protein